MRLLNSSWSGSSVHGILQATILEWELFLLQGIFPSQGLNPGLLRCRQILDHLSHQGSPSTPTTKKQTPSLYITAPFLLPSGSPGYQIPAPSPHLSFLKPKSVSVLGVLSLEYISNAMKSSFSLGSGLTYVLKVYDRVFFFGLFCFFCFTAGQVGSLFLEEGLNPKEQ